MNDTAEKVLVIEDDDVDIRLIQRLLITADHQSFAPTFVYRLRDGVERLKHESFQAVLLDLGLPDSEGGTSAVRAVHEANPDIAIVVLTNLADERLATESLREGAQDYLLKERVDSNSLVRTLRFAMERVRLQHSERRLDEADRKFAAARDVQQALFPKSAPQLAGWEIAGRCDPAEQTGGDYYDYFPMADAAQAIAIGDASGHGLGPALVMTALRSTLRTLAADYNDMYYVISRTNHIMGPDLPKQMFATLMLVRLDPQTAQGVYISAGQPGYLLDRHGQVRSLLRAHFPPVMGGNDFARMEPGEFSMAPGEILLMYTDGITEAGVAREPFGSERMLAVVREHRHENAKTIIEELYTAVAKFTSGEAQHDDMTVVVVKRG